MTTCGWLYLIDDEQEVVWGAEAVALANVARSGVPVLPSFVVSRQAVTAFFVEPALKRAILAALKQVPKSKPQLLAGSAQEVRQHIAKTALPKEVGPGFAAYVKELQDQLLLTKKSGLRLTMTILDGTPHAPHLTERVHTPAEAEHLLKQLLALLFTDEQLQRRLAADEPIVPANVAVLVQASEEAEYSGVAFAHDFERHDDSTIVVRAHYHEHGRSRQLSPVDQYRVDRSTLLLLDKTLGSHRWAEKKTGKHHTPKQAGSGTPILEDPQVLRLAKMVKRAQALFTTTFAFHWSFSHNQLFVASVEPLEGQIAASQRGGAASTNERKPLLTGLPGNLGWASGPVRVVKDRKAEAKLQDGDIVVLEMSLEGDHQWLAGAAGLVFENGHRASHEAFLAKQLGIPAVIATAHGFTHLYDGQVVTVDGTHGAVYAGALPLQYQQPSAYAPTLPATGTKIFAVVNDPQQVTREELAEADGIGLLRSEFILRTLGMHPQDILRKRLGNEYVEVLAEGIEQAVRAVYPRPVIYQLHDVQTATLLGWRERHADRHEPNPALGYRGTHRLLKEPEVLELELQALAAVLAQGVTNLSVMLPMVRSLEEIQQMYALIRRSSLAPHGPVDLWVKCETPALAIRAEELCELPIKGVCFDVPALSTLIVGLDRENYQVGHELDQADEATRQALAYSIATCRAHGLSTTVVAEMEDLRPEVVETAIHAGVSGVCVLPTDIEMMHGLVASIEQRMLLDHLLDENPPVSVEE